MNNDKDQVTVWTQHRGWMAAVGGALFLAGCLGGSSSGGGGGGGGSGGDNGGTVPTTDSITAENAGYVSRLADGLVRGGSGLDGLAGMLADGQFDFLPAGSPASATTAGGAAVSFQSTETEDCPSGGVWSRTETDDEVVVVYDSCASQTGVVRHEADGTVRIQHVTPDDDYLEAQRFVYETLQLSVSRNADSHSLRFDGLFREDRRAHDDLRRTTDFNLRQVFHCRGDSLTMEASQDFVTVVEPGSPGLVISVHGTGSSSGSGHFAGTVTVETLEPVRIADPFGGFPYQGVVRVTAEDGSSVTLEYVEGGVHVDDTFYTWPQYTNTFIENPITELGCFVDEPVDPGPIAEGMRATINGAPWSANPAVSNATLGGAFNVLLVAGIDPSSTANFAVTLNLENMTGPGTYTLSLPGDALHRFAAVVIPDGDQRWDSSLGAGGVVTILSVGDGRVTGTFSFVAGPQEGSGATGTLTVTDGEFNLPLIPL
ncbi:MAG: hypothetical protein JJT90_15950 [Ectothiorhodospiraceae bacterium]|nr:hypothetical protein [Ectothiorhodospiraceae bacterium]